MSRSIQFKSKDNEKMYPHPYYPVGSIYLSVNSTNPSKWFDGTWELIAQGRTLVGVDTNDTDFDEVGKTGGEKTHCLNINEMPSHNHGNNTSVSDTYGYAVMTTEGDFVQTGTGGTYKVKEMYNTGLAGGGQSHNNLQPYFTCYIWCRTA